MKKHEAAVLDASQRRNQVRRMILDNIERVGWHCQAVFPTVKDVAGNSSLQAFVYSIGLTNGLGVELLNIGNFSAPLIGSALNALAIKFIQEGVVEEGIVDIGWTVPVKVRLCGERALKEYAILVDDFCAPPYKVIQFLLPDAKGVYQDDEACEWGKVDLP